MNTLGIFAKHPQPGRVKTRLAAGLGDQRAAELYAAFVGDLIDRFGAAADRRILAYAPHEPEAAAYFRGLCGGRFALWPQPSGDLGGRMRAFFADAFEGGAERVVLIGSDSPTLPVRYVQQAFDDLAVADCVLGPATDGGYYLIAMRRIIPAAFNDVEWSGPRVLEQTVQRLRETGDSLRMLPVWYDVDSPADLKFLRAHRKGLAAAGSPDAAPRTAAWLDSRIQDDETLL
ncbi:MAG: TIGR04282 family arsenosugar biosynthesis glycosyltransferase [Planctomycetaceae bacterium]